MFRDRIIDIPKALYSEGFDQNGWKLGKDYEFEVCAKHRNNLKATLMWLSERGAIDDEDLDKFDAIRRHRNEVTHELSSFLGSVDRNLELRRFEELIELLRKVEKWWFEYFELEVNPELLPEGANIDNVVPGSLWGLQLALDIALGNEPEEGYYYNEFRKLRT